MPTTNLISPVDRARVVAATLLAEAQAIQLGQAYVAAAAGVLRYALPAATSVLVAIQGWSTLTDDVIEVTVLAVHDADGAALWNQGDATAPDLPDVDGGWQALSESAADTLQRVLEHAAPGPCGWTAIEPNHDDPEFDTEHYRVALPAAGAAAPEMPDPERVLAQMAPLITQLGLTIGLT